MANIFLTKKCNLKCPYCFADEFVNKDNQEIYTEYDKIEALENYDENENLICTEEAKFIVA